MSVLERQRAIVIRVREASNLANGDITARMHMISNVPNRDELIGLLMRAIWMVGQGDDAQRSVDSLDELVQNLPEVAMPDLDEGPAF